MTLVRRSVSELGTIRLCSPCPNAALLEAATEGCRLLARRWQAEADLDVFLRLARVGNVEAAVFFDEECARMVYGYLKLFMLERACSVEHHSPQLQFLVAYHLHFGGIADDADGAVLPVFLHFIGSVLAGYHDVGVCGSRRLHAVVEVQSEDILVYAIFRSGMVDIIPCAALCLLGYGYLPAVREEIGHIVVEHPLRRAVVGCGCFLGRNDFAGRYGSQGQQRTAALSLKMSEIELVRSVTGDTPVLLLDDVLSELDKNRQNYLLDSIHDIQTIVTCTGLEELISHRFAVNRVFYVKDGSIVEKKA